MSHVESRRIGSCDCDVNELLSQHRENPFWANCIRWDEKHWWLRCPRHRVYLLIEEDARTQP